MSIPPPGFVPRRLGTGPLDQMGERPESPAPRAGNLDSDAARNPLARMHANATTGKQMILPAVEALVSASGGATVLSVLSADRETSMMLREKGFSWSHSDKMLLRVSTTEEVSVEDLVAVDAIRPEWHEDGVVVVRARSYLPYISFTGMNTCLKRAGFNPVRRVISGPDEHGVSVLPFPGAGASWSKAMTRFAYDKLMQHAGTRCAVQRFKKEKEASDAINRAVSDVWQEYTAVKRATHRAALAANDPTYQRRDYEYTQILKEMDDWGTYVVGKDGAPNWPSPPEPGGTQAWKEGDELLVWRPDRGF